MRVMQHHHTHTVSSSCLVKILRWPTVPTPSYFNTITRRTSRHPVWTAIRWPAIPIFVIHNACDVTPSHAHRLVVLFENPYIDPPPQHSLFVMLVIQHHHIYNVLSSCLKKSLRWDTRYFNTITRTTSRHPVWTAIRWPTIPTFVISNVCDATPSHAHRLVILFENPYVYPPPQHPLFVMLVIQHHNTHPVLYVTLGYMTHIRD